MPHPIFPARFHRLISHPQLQRLLFPDLHLICHHHSHENQRSGCGYHEGSFPPALQRGLAGASPTSNTWTQLTLPMPADPSPPSREGGMASGCPSCGQLNATSHGLTYHTQTMNGSTYRAGPACAGNRKETSGFWGEDPSNLHFAKGRD